MAETDVETCSVQENGERREVELLRYEVKELRRMLLEVKTANEELSEENDALKKQYSSESHARLKTPSTSSEDSFRLGFNEVKTLIPAFDPKRTKYGIESWINDFENLAKLYDWNGRQKVLYASLRLDGAAKLWFQTQQAHCETWVEMRRTLLKGFPSGHNETTILKEIMTRKKKDSEELEEYFYEMVSLGRRIQLQDTTMIDYIINGLPNVAMKRSLLAVTFECLEDLLNKMKKMELLNQECHDYKSTKRYPTKMPDYNENNK